MNNEIKTINSMLMLLKSDAVNFFFDLEDTILAENIFYSALSQQYFTQILMNLITKYSFIDIKKLISYGKNHHREILDPNTTHVFNTLDSNGKNQMALTSGFLSIHKVHRLFDHGIFFKHIIFTRKIDKGPIIVEFIKKYNIQGKCAFIDNDLHKVENVREHYELFSNEPIDLYVYHKTYNKKVTKEDFINYWTDTIKSFIKKYKKILND